MTCPYVPDCDLEARALALLTQYERQERPIVGPPVPVDHIIEHVLGIGIDWTELTPDHSSDRVLACIRLTPSGCVIQLNTRERSFFDSFFGTIPYSMAHEVGHALLHLPASAADQPPLLSDAGEILLCRSDNHDRREIQAERFAAFLLMPEHLVHSAVGGAELSTWPQVYALRDQFEVSVTAMRLRLSSLNLLHIAPDGRLFPNREAASGQQRLL